MAKYDYLNDEAVKHIETNSNNTYCKRYFQRVLFRDWTFKKHIATIRYLDYLKK
jgi:hypothetical protein